MKQMHEHLFAKCIIVKKFWIKLSRLVIVIQGGEFSESEQADFIEIMRG